MIKRERQYRPPRLQIGFETFNQLQCAPQSSAAPHSQDRHSLPPSIRNILVASRRRRADPRPGLAYHQVPLST